MARMLRSTFLSSSSLLPVPHSLITATMWKSPDHAPNTAQAWSKLISWIFAVVSVGTHWYVSQSVALGLPGSHAL